MKKIILTICLLLLVGCNNQQQTTQQDNQSNTNQAIKVEKKEKEIIESDSTIEKSNSKDDSIEKKSNLETYTPSEQINKNLEEFLDDLSMVLMRGDAELAPTYEETMIKVSKSQKKLETAIDLFEAESADKNVSDDLNKSFSKFKKINDEISMALMRGDAELAPTYEEFMINMGNIIYEFRKAYEVYKN